VEFAHPEVGAELVEIDVRLDMRVDIIENIVGDTGMLLQRFFLHNNYYSNNEQFYKQKYFIKEALKKKTICF
jgi:hypothetical protein